MGRRHRKPHRRPTAARNAPPAPWPPAELAFTPERAEADQAAVAMPSDRIAPGQALLCRGCQHWLSHHWGGGHPTPCSMVRWQGVRQIVPQVIQGAGQVVTCSDFAAKETEAIDSIGDNAARP